MTVPRETAPPGWAVDSPRLTAALRLASLDFEVVACWGTTPAGDCRCRDGAACSRKPGKHPLAPDGSWQETRDQERIRTMLTAASEPNYGVIPPLGCLALDVDGPAEATLAGLGLSLGPLPDTYGHATRNGRHLFFRWPAAIDRPRSAQLFGMVTRWGGPAGGRGYVIGPGSAIGDFEYSAFGEPEAIAELPEAWARAALEQGQAPRSAFGDVQVGQRHAELRDAARYLRGRGFEGEALRTAVRGINAALPEPKDDAAVLRAIGDVETKFGPDPDTSVDDAPVSEAPGGIDGVDLLALDLPPLRWIVPDLIPEGTTVIASPPKIGKSCLVYGIVAEVAIGGELLGRRVAPGAALYLALEDGRRRGQDRLKAALKGRTLPRGRLEVRWSARKLGAGLEDDLRAWLDQHADAAVVAIDTLGKVRQRSDGRRNAYEIDVEDLGRVQDLFRDRNVALIIVHHAKKETGDDFVAAVSGTYGITGSADTIVSVKRPRLETFGSLLVTGRDVADAKIPVRFDGLTWSQAPDSLPEASFSRAEIYRVVEERGPIFPAAIATALDLERSNVQHRVAALVDDGAIARTPKGYVVSRARVDHVPSHLNHWGSDASDAGHPRARTRPRSVGEEMAAIFHPDEPEDVDAEDLDANLVELFPDQPAGAVQ